MIKGTEIPAQRTRNYAFIVDQFELVNTNVEDIKKVPICKIYFENVKNV